jgi:hypothetical protein
VSGLLRSSDCHVLWVADRLSRAAVGRWGRFVICSENVAAPAVGEGDPLVMYTPGDRETAREDGRGASVL